MVAKQPVASKSPRDAGVAAVAGCSAGFDLDDSVSVWSDFLRPHLHPRTMHIVNDYQHNRYGQGYCYYYAFNVRYFRA